MAAFTTIFDNRELAFLIWLSGLVAFGFLSKRLRPSFMGVLKGFLAPKLITAVALMAGYGDLLVYLLYVSNVWTSDLGGETIFWFFGPAFLFFFQLDKASQDPHFFRRTFISVFRLTVFIEFFVNAYPLNLVAELLLVPVFVLLGGMVAVAGTRAPD